MFVRQFSSGIEQSTYLTGFSEKLQLLEKETYARYQNNQYVFNFVLYYVFLFYINSKYKKKIIHVPKTTAEVNQGIDTVLFTI